MIISQFLVYGLVDPRSDEIEYIGKSSSGISRPLQHFSEYGHGPKHGWLEELKSLNLSPRIKILEEISVDCKETHSQEEWELIKKDLHEKLSASESKWIEKLLVEGSALKNVTIPVLEKPDDSVQHMRVKTKFGSRQVEISDNQELSIVKMFNEGWSATKISDRFKTVGISVSTKTLRKVLSKHGFQIGFKKNDQYQNPDPTEYFLNELKSMVREYQSQPDTFMPEMAFAGFSAAWPRKLQAPKPKRGLCREKFLRFVKSIEDLQVIEYTMVHSPPRESIADWFTNNFPDFK